MNTQLLIKALYAYRKSKKDTLRNNLRHDRPDQVDKNITQILEIDRMIDQMENKLITDNLN
jgi:hypothetical protein